MLIREYSRRNDKITSELKLKSASELKDCFQFPVAITPIKKNYMDKNHFNNIGISSENYMRLMGWYLSDGTVTLRKNKNSTVVKSIVISQRPDGKLSTFMKYFYNKYS